MTAFVYQHHGTVAMLRVQVALDGRLGASYYGEGKGTKEEGLPEWLWALPMFPVASGMTHLHAAPRGRSSLKPSVRITSVQDRRPPETGPRWRMFAQNWMRVWWR